MSQWLSDNTATFAHPAPPRKMGTPLIRHESNHLRHKKFIKSCCKNPSGGLCFTALQGMGNSQQSWSRSLSLGLLAHDSITQDLTHHLRCENEYRLEAWAMASREARWCEYEYESPESGLTLDRVGTTSTDDHCNTLEHSSLSYPRAEHRKPIHPAVQRWVDIKPPALHP